MSTKIKDIRIWRNPTKTETRIYVHTTDGREGCKYITGNPWHAKGSIDGNLTAEDWAEAKSIAVWENSSGKRVWHTVYESEIHGYSNARPQRCPDCGGYDCGPNCNSNRPTMQTYQHGLDRTDALIETGRV